MRDGGIRSLGAESALTSIDGREALRERPFEKVPISPISRSSRSQPSSDKRCPDVDRSNTGPRKVGILLEKKRPCQYPLLHLMIRSDDVKDTHIIHTTTWNGVQMKITEGETWSSTALLTLDNGSWRPHARCARELFVIFDCKSYQMEVELLTLQGKRGTFPSPYKRL